MKTRPLRTIVIGFGQIAAGLTDDARMARYFTYATHGQVLADHTGFQWAGVVDPDAGAQAKARDWGVPVIGGDLKTVAEQVKPEVAVITAPPHARLDMIRHMPDLKAVLVEKPLSVGGDEGERFLAACNERHILTQVNFWRRADPTFRALADGGLGAQIGDAQTAFATYGNGLFNNGSHMIDFIRMLLGEIRTVQATGSAVEATGAPHKGDIHVPFSLMMASGITVAVHPVDFRHYREVGLDIWGTQGRLALYQESLGMFHYPLSDNRGLENEREIASDAPSATPPTVGQAFYAMYDNLKAAVESDQALWSDGASALKTEAVLDAIVRSVDSGGGRIRVG